MKKMENKMNKKFIKKALLFLFMTLLIQPLFSKPIYPPSKFKFLYKDYETFKNVYTNIFKENIKSYEKLQPVKIGNKQDMVTISINNTKMICYIIKDEDIFNKHISRLINKVESERKKKDPLQVKCLYESYGNVILKYYKRIYWKDSIASKAFGKYLIDNDLTNVEKLLKMGINPNMQVVLTKKKRIPGMSMRQSLATPIRLALDEMLGVKAPLNINLKKRDTALLDLVMKYGATMNCGYSNWKSGNPMLTWFVAGYMKIVKYLIEERGADINYDSGQLLQLALQMTDRNSRKIPIKKTILYMLKKGIVINGQDFMGETPLVKTIERKQSKYMRILLSKNADITLVDKYGNGAISKALEVNNKEFIALILKKKVSIPDKLYHTESLIVKFCKYGNIKKLKAILKISGKSKELFEKYKTEGLQFAVYKKGNAKMVKYLLSKGADPFQVDKYNRMAIDSINRNEQPGVRNVFKKYLKKVKRPTMVIPTRYITYSRDPYGFSKSRGKFALNETVEIWGKKSLKVYSGRKELWYKLRSLDGKKYGWVKAARLKIRRR